MRKVTLRSGSICEIEGNSAVNRINCRCDCVLLFPCRAGTKRTAPNVCLVSRTWYTPHKCFVQQLEQELPVSKEVNDSTYWREFENNPLSHSMAHYLMAIDALRNDLGYARSTDVAEMLDVSR